MRSCRASRSRIASVNEGLCRRLGDLATETWAHMDYGFNRGYGRPDERAFTDHHLIELCRHHQREIQASKFDQNTEAQTAADFEWWIGDGESYLPARVQAKKLHLHDAAYQELANPTSDKTELQIERLIRAAREDGFLPLYLFFNGPTKDDPGPDRCANLAHQPENRGCAIAWAPEVLRVMTAAKNRHLTTIAPACWPWQCFICCPAVGGLHPGQRLLDLLSVGGVDLESEPGARLTRDLPDYVRITRNADFLGVVPPDQFDPDPLPGARTVLTLTLS